MADAGHKVDRQMTTPFLLKLFYRHGGFHRLDEFAPNLSGGTAPQHLQIYTWPDATLHELSLLLTSALPTLLPSPAVGTRIAFRLVYPDTRAPPGRAEGPGRYLAKELGNVVVGAKTEVEESNGDSAGLAGAQLEGDAEKSLQDARFVIGDYISCAVVPPLPNGSVAPPPAVPMGGSSRPPPRGGYGGPPRRGGGYRGEFGGHTGHVPSGDWRRGERIPDGPSYGGYGRRGRGRG